MQWCGIRIKIKNELVNYEKTMKKLFLSDNLSAIFSIYNISFWDEIKIDLTTTFRNRLHWYMELIYSSIKEAMRKTENVDEQPAFDMLRSLESVKKVYNSEDLSEGASSFVKKEKPKWKGK